MKEIDKTCFSQNFERFRKDKKFTQTDIANKVGVKRASVSLWEGGGSPKFETFLKLCDVLEVTPNDLILPQAENIKYIASKSDLVLAEPSAFYKTIIEEKDKSSFSHRNQIDALNRHIEELIKDKADLKEKANSQQKNIETLENNNKMLQELLKEKDKKIGQLEAALEKLRTA